MSRIITSEHLEPLDREAIRKLAPAATKGRMTLQDRENLGISDHFNFFNTGTVVDDLGEMGWVVVDAIQQKAKKNPNTTKHMLRFRNPDFSQPLTDNGLIPEILVTNSHDGQTAFKFHVALFRIICSNGLVIADTTFEQFKVPHMGYSFDVARDYMKLVTNRTPDILRQINKFSKTRVDENGQLQYATEALLARYAMDYTDRFDRTVDWKQLKKDFDPHELLVVQRPEDEGDSLWKVYNRVQENLIKGNYSHWGKDSEGKDKTRGARELTNIRNSLIANKELWSLTKRYAGMDN